MIYKQPNGFLFELEFIIGSTGWSRPPYCRAFFGTHFFVRFLISIKFWHFFWQNLLFIYYYFIYYFLFAIFCLFDKKKFLRCFDKKEMDLFQQNVVVWQKWIFWRKCIFWKKWIFWRKFCIFDQTRFFFWKNGFFEKSAFFMTKVIFFGKSSFFWDKMY